jgi:uncharacterized protein YndB with AHSA1/START domain
MKNEMDLDLKNMPELAHDERAIVTSRVFWAPRAMVYQAFADPKQLVQWWGPHGFTTTIKQMDLRAGGQWMIVMHGPDGTNYPNEMTFTEVVPNERIRLDLVCKREGAATVRMKKTITWEDAPGGTRLTFRIEFASREERDTNVRQYGSVKGGRELFDRLAAVLENTLGHSIDRGVGHREVHA